MRMLSAIGLCFLALAAAAAVTAAHAQLVNDKVLRDVSRTPGEWLTTGRDYAESRYSPLDQINSTNVERLGLAWWFDTDSLPGNLEATPTLWNDTLYITGTWSVVYAVDAHMGKLKWRFDPKISHQNFPLGPDGIPDSTKPRTGPTFCCGPVNRGVAIYDDKIYVGLLDGRLVALDAETGNVVWQVQTTDPSADYNITGAPRIIGDKVIIGNGGAEYAVRGYVTAYDAETGKQAWRFYTVPGDPSKPFENKALQIAAKTWKGDEWYKMGGGGTAWDSFTYDPELNLVYFGTGNGAPYPQRYRSPGGGDNLFVCSIVALHADTGKYAWHFQETPGDEWDYDAVQNLILADLNIDGRKRRVIMQASKNGFLYVLDAKTGKFISGKPLVKVTWTTGLDPVTGRPNIPSQAFYDNAADGVWIVPGGGGVHSTHVMSYNPILRLVYIPGGISSEWYAIDPNFKYKVGVNNWGQLRNAPIYGERVKRPEPGPQQPPPDISVAITTSADEGRPAPGAGAPATPRANGGRSRSFLVAWDPATQTERWRDPDMNGGGTMTTNGDLVFGASSDGHFVALTADKGQRLWQAQLLPGMSGPSTYLLDGKQYVAVLAGTAGHGRLYAFMLDGKAPMPPSSAANSVALGAGSKTTLDGIYTDAQAARGKAGYARNCALCHAADLAGSGEIPALAGDAFVATWNGHTMNDLFDLTQSTMPKGSPFILPPQTYADILAYMLSVNHFPAGRTDLGTESTVLKAIFFVPGKTKPQ